MAATEDTLKKIDTDRRVKKLLGRLKGESLQTLEEAEAAISQALKALRAEGADAKLSTSAYAQIAKAHSALTRVLAKQQVVKGARLVLSCAQSP